MEQEKQTQQPKEKKYVGEPVGVRNKDIPVLQYVLCIMQDICMIERRSQWHQDRLFNITQHITGMQIGSGSPKGMEEAFATLSELENELRDDCKEYAHQLRKAQRILNSIESRSMRTFVMMRYVMNIPDAEIRRELNMTRRGFDRARVAVELAQSMADVKWQERHVLTTLQ